MQLGKETKAVSCADAVSKKILSGQLIAYYLARVQQLYEKYGVPLQKMRLRELADNERAFYAKEAWDFEVECSEGWVELIACNNRGDYDLKGHAKESKKELKIKEEGDSEAFIPHVFELSTGIDRTLYVLLDLAYKKEKRGPEERVYLDLNPKIAPYFAAVFPLVNKEGIDERAKVLANELSECGFDILYDDRGSIGKRYARADEIGVPFAITLDFDTLKDASATLRERSSMQQKRIKIAELPELLWKLELGKEEF